MRGALHLNCEERKKNVKKKLGGAGRGKGEGKKVQGRAATKKENVLIHQGHDTKCPGARKELPQKLLREKKKNRTIDT